MKMRAVGNQQWQEFAASPQEALERGARLDATILVPFDQDNGGLASKTQ